MKIFAKLLLFAALLQPVVLVPRAHAIVGLASANPALAIAGGVVLGIGAHLAAPGAILISIEKHDSVSSSNGSLYGNGAFVSGMLTFLDFVVAGGISTVGVILLPEGDRAAVRLAPLSEAQRAAFMERGLSAEVLAAYEDERTELEAISQEVGLALQARVLPSSTAEQLLAWSREEWSARKHLVSSEAFAALAAIVARDVEGSAHRR